MEAGKAILALNAFDREAAGALDPDLGAAVSWATMWR